MPTQPSFVWITNSGQRWKIAFEVYVGIFGFAAFAIGTLALVVSFFVGPKALWLLGVVWAVYVVLRIAQHVVVYHFIRCPRCRFNPTRRQSDGEAMNPAVLWGRLGGFESCPNCGDRGATVGP